ncbi:MAG: sigma-70 family RNA polymerase sigma factor [Acidobacteriota bacterium]|nr:sigma-70 family RNA polymerase sigma factor [Acidobacteriota bacterium]
MDQALESDWPSADRDRRLADAVAQNWARLRNFVRKRVADRADAEDVLQDVFFELVESYRFIKPIDQGTAWLFRVARNRIIDLFRRKQRESRRSSPSAMAREDGEMLAAEDLLPSHEAGPEAAFARSVLLEALEDALAELPEEQRDVFIAHELMGYTFEEISRDTGVSVNTLLSRKHHAVVRLRERLRSIYDDFKNL